MSLATAELPADPADLRAFALACQGELKAAQTAVQLKALEIDYRQASQWMSATRRA